MCASSMYRSMVVCVFICHMACRPCNGDASDTQFQFIMRTTEQQTTVRCDDMGNNTFKEGTEFMLETQTFTEKCKCILRPESDVIREPRLTLKAPNNLTEEYKYESWKKLSTGLRELEVVIYPPHFANSANGRISIFFGTTGTNETHNELSDEELLLQLDRWSHNMLFTCTSISIPTIPTLSPTEGAGIDATVVSEVTDSPSTVSEVTDSTSTVSEVTDSTSTMSKVTDSVTPVSKVTDSPASTTVTDAHSTATHPTSSSTTPQLDASESVQTYYLYLLIGSVVVLMIILFVAALLFCLLCRRRGAKLCRKSEKGYTVHPKNATETVSYDNATYAVNMKPVNDNTTDGMEEPGIEYAQVNTALLAKKSPEQEAKERARKEALDTAQVTYADLAFNQTLDR